MNTPLGSELAVEVGQFLHQVEVVQQEGPARACGAGVLVIGDRMPLALALVRAYVTQVCTAEFRCEVQAPAYRATQQLID